MQLCSSAALQLCKGCWEQHSWYLQVRTEPQVSAVEWYQWPAFTIGWNCLTARRFWQARHWIFAKCNYLTDEGWFCMNILCFTMTMKCCTSSATFHFKVFLKFLSFSRSSHVTRTRNATPKHFMEFISRLLGYCPSIRCKRSLLTGLEKWSEFGIFQLNSFIPLHDGSVLSSNRGGTWRRRSLNLCSEHTNKMVMCANNLAQQIKKLANCIIRPCVAECSLSVVQV